MKYEIKKSSQEETKKAPLLGFSRGFTLLETLVAIAILLTAVVGPISIIGDSLHKLYYARDQMAAINLAQEGVEAVRQTRDSNLLAGVSWTTGLADGYYIVDVSTLSGALLVLQSPCTGACLTGLPVYVDSISGLFRQTGGATNTHFTRIVNITTVSAGVEMKVTSTVSWTTGGNSGTVSVSENLFKWTI